MKTEMPVLTVTNPIWLFLFKHGFEDPNWGKRPIEQQIIAIAIHELSAMITHEDTRTQIQSSISKSMIALSQDLARESESDKKTY